MNKHMRQQAVEGEQSTPGGCLSRRSLLKAGAGTAIIITGLPGMPSTSLAATVVEYPRQFLATLDEQEIGKPLHFTYPEGLTNGASLLVKLGEEAGGGIGPDIDIVAFNALCTHMGGDMSHEYKPDHQVLGPCPFHQSTFDLTRHGIIVSGHATQSLPQVMLELNDNDIYAVGLLGLIYGHFDNQL